MAPDPYTVVVGVSPTSKSPTALQWALDQARHHGGRVVAVRAWQLPRSAPPSTVAQGTSAGRVPTATSLESQARQLLVEDVEHVLGPDSGVEIRVIRGGRRKSLVKAARGADLLVVDAPRALTTGPMFAHRLVYSASCPVVVMPPHISGAPPSWLQRLSVAAGRQTLQSLGSSGRPGLSPRQGRTD